MFANVATVCSFFPAPQIYLFHSDFSHVVLVFIYFPHFVRIFHLLSSFLVFDELNVCTECTAYLFPCYDLPLASRTVCVGGGLCFLVATFSLFRISTVEERVCLLLSCLLSYVCATFSSVSLPLLRAHVLTVWLFFPCCVALAYEYYALIALCIHSSLSNTLPLCSYMRCVMVFAILIWFVFH